METQLQINCNVSAGWVDWQVLHKMLAKQLNEVTVCGYCVYRLFTLPPSDQHYLKASLTAILFTGKK